MTTSLPKPAPLPSSNERRYAASRPAHLRAARFDALLLVGTTPGGYEIGYNDDACDLQSEVTAHLSAGTYYVTIEAYEGCGDYVLEIAEGSGRSTGSRADDHAAEIEQ